MENWKIKSGRLLPPVVTLEIRRSERGSITSSLSILDSCYNVSRDLCTVGSRSVRHPSTRWKIVSAGNGAFYIISAASANLALNVNGAGKKREDELMVSTRVAEAHFHFELKKPGF
ncbi:hypothetical protein FRB95_002339 [Tulasnella sp. JGI-2019a]|nr:hypothetical protein FRB95_002339 [Tulasnella sp. JGI-2019a]